MFNLNLVYSMREERKGRAECKGMERKDKVRKRGNVDRLEKGIRKNG